MKELLGFLLCLILSGCSTVQYADITPEIPIVVNSISSSEQVSEKKCVVLSGMQNVHNYDLQFKEYLAYVKIALEWKGYELVDKEEEANIVIFLGYGIGDPKEHVYSYAMPVYGKTGVLSSTTTGAANTTGNMNVYGNNASLFGATTQQSTTVYTPSYGVIGATSHVGTYETYAKDIVLDAFDLKFYRENKTQKELWRTEISSSGSSSDLRKMFPVMIAAASEYLGGDTKKNKTVYISSDSEKVLRIKGINPEVNVGKFDSTLNPVNANLKVKTEGR